MNIPKIIDAMEFADDSYILEASECGNKKKKIGVKKIAVIAALIAVLACSAVPLSADAIRRFAWSGKQEDPIIEEGVYFDSFWEHEHYFGSVKDGTSIPVPEDAVKITAVNVDEITVKFVLDVDTSVAPFDVYSTVVIPGGELHIENSEDSRTDGTLGGLINPLAGIISEETTGTGWFFPDNSDRLANKDYYIGYEKYIEKIAYPDEMCPPKTYWAYFYILGAYDEDGNGVEIRREGNLPWIVEFTF